MRITAAFYVAALFFLTHPAPALAKNTYVPKSEQTYITGKRGGCYYINRNGNKTYVDRKLCK